MLAKPSNNNSYKNTEISTANQKKLIIMLYDGAMRFLQIAENNMEPRTYDVANENILKAQDIITELILALDMKRGKEIAANLFHIYAFFKKRLIEGNIAKDAKIVKEVSKMLKELRDAWEKTEEITTPPQSTVRNEGIGLSIKG